MRSMLLLRWMKFSCGTGNCHLLKYKVSTAYIVSLYVSIGVYHCKINHSVITLFKWLHRHWISLMLYFMKQQSSIDQWKLSHVFQKTSNPAMFRTDQWGRQEPGLVGFVLVVINVTWVEHLSQSHHLSDYWRSFIEHKANVLLVHLHTCTLVVFPLNSWCK